MSVVDDHVTINRGAAQQSVVLLKNTDNLLPIDFSKFTSVAIIGPCADDPVCSRGIYGYSYNYTCQLIILCFNIGDYDPEPKYIVTVKQAFSNSTKLKVTLCVFVFRTILVIPPTQIIGFFFGNAVSSACC